MLNEEEEEKKAEKEEGKSYQFGPSNPHNHLVKKFINNFLFQINKVSLTK